MRGQGKIRSIWKDEILPAGAQARARGRGWGVACCDSVAGLCATVGQRPVVVTGVSGGSVGSATVWALCWTGYGDIKAQARALGTEALLGVARSHAIAQALQVGGLSVRGEGCGGACFESWTGFLEQIGRAHV